MIRLAGGARDLAQVFARARARANALALANSLAHASALASDLDNAEVLAHADTLADTLADALASDLDNADVLAHANVLADTLDHALDHALDRALANTNALADTNALANALSNALVHANALANSVARARDLALVGLDPAAHDARAVVAGGDRSMPGRVPRGLVALTVRMLPAPQRSRYHAEFRVELLELSSEERWRYAWRVLFRAWPLRQALVEAVCTPDGATARRAAER